MSGITIDAAARTAHHLIASGQADSEDLWRFVILQLLDDYESTKASRGVAAAGALMEHAPRLTGHSGVDAALAALTCWLADRDGWEAPAWAVSADRAANPWWFVSSSAYGPAWAMVQSPAHFRIRGVFITDSALQRA